MREYEYENEGMLWVSRWKRRKEEGLTNLI